MEEKGQEDDVSLRQELLRDLTRDAVEVRPCAKNLRRDMSTACASSQSDLAGQDERRERTGGSRPLRGRVFVGKGWSEAET